MSLPEWVCGYANSEKAGLPVTVYVASYAYVVNSLAKMLYATIYVV